MYARSVNTLITRIVEKTIRTQQVFGTSKIAIEIHADNSVTAIATDSNLVEVPMTAKEFRKSVEVMKSGHFVNNALAISNFLSEIFRLEYRFSKSRLKIECNRGITSEFVEVSDSTNDGAERIVTFKPDAEIFTKNEFSSVHLARFLQQCSGLNRDIRFSFHNAGDGYRAEFYSPSGLANYFTTKYWKPSDIHSEVIHIHGTDGETEIDAAFQWTESKSSEFLAWANGELVSEGPYQQGLSAAIAETLCTFGRDSGELANNDLPEGVYLEGLTVLLSMRLKQPVFDVRKSERLENPELEQVVKTIISPKLMSYWQAHPAVATSIIRFARDLRTSDSQTTS